MSARHRLFSHLRRPSKSTSYRTRILSLFLIFFALLLLYEAYLRQTIRRKIEEYTRPPTQLSHIASHVHPPILHDLQLENAQKTLFLIPGKENRCHYQYDYVCKFWFYIRCYVYAAFPRVEMLDSGINAVQQFKERAKDGDIALVIWRSKNHSLVPEALKELQRWRREAARMGLLVPRVRIGVFHIANENIRDGWGWYERPDFVIRSYWIGPLPPHVTYIPLGPQLPNQCTPRSTDESMGNEREGVDGGRGCSCNGLVYKYASKREYLWSFSGSLRKRRAELLRKLKKSKRMSGRGYVQVSKKFGGDGVFGSIAENPKNAYLESTLESQFVFAPCGNAMETHRIYEALSLGAIPVIEDCDTDVDGFFPMKELMMKGGTDEMLRFVEGFLDKPEEVDRLQKRVAEWWEEYSTQIARNVSRTILGHVASVEQWTP